MIRRRFPVIVLVLQADQMIFWCDENSTWNEEITCERMIHFLIL